HTRAPSVPPRRQLARARRRHPLLAHPGGDRLMPISTTGAGTSNGATVVGGGPSLNFTLASNSMYLGQVV
ncbi:hypothetical protein ACSTK7_23760, partial [Vibrio parahaemolyticus]